MGRTNAGGWRRQLRLTWHLPAVLTGMALLVVGFRVWPWLSSEPPRVLRLSGSHAEIGLAHGTALAEEIHRAYEDYVLGGLVEHAGWTEPALLELARHYEQRIPERYQREIRGISEGSSVSYERVVLLNVLPDVLLGGRPRRAGSPRSTQAMACSSVAAVDEEGLIVGRNLDWLGYGVGHRLGVVTIVEAEGEEPVLGIGWPGLAGVITGMNGAGLVAALHTAPAIDVEPDATPILFRIRSMLAAEATVGDAASRILVAPRTIALNLLVAGGGGEAATAEVLELTGHRQAQVRMRDGLVATTNYYQALDGPGGSGADRLRELEERLSDPTARTPRGVKRALSRVAMPGFGGSLETLHSAIFEPEKGRVLVAMGARPATWGRYFEIEVELEARPRAVRAASNDR